MRTSMFWTFALFMVAGLPLAVAADPPPKPKPSAVRRVAGATTGQKTREKASPTARSSKSQTGEPLLSMPQDTQSTPERTAERRHKTRHPFLTPEDRARFRVSHPLITPKTKSVTKHIPVLPEKAPATSESAPELPKPRTSTDM